MNPNFLLKDELQYELKICGINSEANIQTLHKLFRSVVCNLYSLSVEELFGCVVSKTVELQGLVTQQKLDLSLMPCFSTKIAHLRGCLIHLATLGLASSDITTSHYQELHDQLDHIEHNITSMDMAEYQDQERVEQDTGHDMGQRDSGTSHESSVGKEEERQDTENVSTDMVSVNNDTSALAALVAQPKSVLSTVGVLVPAQSVKQVFTPHFYQRLP